MKKNRRYLALCAICLSFCLWTPMRTFSGNPDRSGSAGAQELLINPYASSSGWAGVNTANVRGIDAMFNNVAGLAFTRGTDVSFNRMAWMGGSGITINNLGFSQHVGETGALGINVMAMSAGQIPITTVDNPEGGLGTFSPSFINIGISYAKGFSDNIYGGATVRIIQESISNVQSKGISIDAGIQYHAGKMDQMHFGISLKNVGPKMSYQGDGLTFTSNILNGSQFNYTSVGYTATFENRSMAYELPSLLNIGAAYDFYLTKDTSGVRNKHHRVTVAGNFTSNSFTYDQFIGGVEYGFRNMLIARFGYAYEAGITGANTRSALLGPTFGATLQYPKFGRSKQSTIALDYSYRPMFPFTGTSCIGLRVSF